jgi:hypothetical protein
MSGPRERRWPGRVAGYAALMLVLAGVTTAFYVPAEPRMHPLIVRLAVAALVAVVLLHVHSRLRRRCDDVLRSEFERALAPETPPPASDPLVVKLREEVVNSRRSGWYFAHVLWPRLEALAPGLELPPAPRLRRWLRRGPSWRTLAALVADAEEKP